MRFAPANDLNYSKITACQLLLTRLNDFIMRNLFHFKPLSLLLLTFLLYHATVAQTPSPGDSDIYRSAVDSTIALFYSRSKSVSACYNGKEYIPPQYNFSEGSPYFLAPEARPGTITYDHVKYNDVRLLFDELQNNLVFVDETHRIMLLNEKVERFSILDYHFVNILPQDPANGEKVTGYFQVLFDGNCLLLKKEEKKIRELSSFSAQELAKVVDTRSVWYIKKENEYYKIDGKKTFFELWATRQKEIKDFIKQNHIKFKSNVDDDYAKVTAFCDQLTPSK